MLGERIARFAPSRPGCWIPPRQTWRPAPVEVHDPQPFIRVVRIAEGTFNGAVRRNVPRVVPGDSRKGACGPLHPSQRARPDSEHEIAGQPQERFVHDELVVSVLMQSFEACAIVSHSVHARGVTAPEFDPLGFERMKPGMDHRARKRDFAPA
jgi:hypothetical protein